MRNLDLAAELGASTYVFWGGREGSETDCRQGRAGRARPLPRGASTPSRSTSSTGATACASRSSPSPTSRAATSCCRPSGTRWPSSPRLEHADMVGLNPEVGHEQMSNLNFVHAISQALWQGKLFHIDLNGQHGPKFDQDLVFGHGDLLSAFFLVDLLENGGATGGWDGPAYDGPRHFDYKPLRTEDIDGVWASAAANMRTYLLLKDRAAAFRADPEVQAALEAVRRCAELAVPTLADGRDLRRPARRPRRPSRTSTPTPSRRWATRSSSSTSSPSSTCWAPADDALGPRRHRWSRASTRPPRPARSSCATPGPGRSSASAGRRTRTAPRSTRRPGGRRCRSPWPRPAGSTTSRRCPSAASSTAWCASTSPATSYARPCCGTTSGPRPRPGTCSTSSAAAQAWADAVGVVPVASITVTKLRWLADHEPDHAGRTAAVCLPHDWLTWRLAGCRCRRRHHRPQRRERHRLLVGRDRRLPARPARACPRRPAARCPACVGPHEVAAHHAAPWRGGARARGG